MKENSLKNWLLEQIQAVLSKPVEPAPFILWCDPAREWKELLQRACDDQFELWADDGQRTNAWRPPPRTIAEFIFQEGLYQPDINDGVRVNIAPLQKAGLLTADVLAGKDIDKAIADRAIWRDDERRWCREGKLPKPGWWE